MDKLGTLKQNSLMARYLTKYRNIDLMIGHMNEAEKVDRCVDELKHTFPVIVLKTNCNSFTVCACSALDADSSIWIARREASGFQHNNNNEMRRFLCRLEASIVVQ